MSENGEVLTPREEAEIRAELTVRDAWLAVTEVLQLYCDPTSRPFIESLSVDIGSMRTMLDLLASAIMETPNG